MDKELLAMINNIDSLSNDKRLLIDEQESEQLDGIAPTDIDGYVEVRDHQLFVIDPKEGGKKPKIQPGKSVKILVNKVALTKERIVSEKDEIVWSPQHQNLYEISVSKDKMVSTLILFPELYIDFLLKDKRRSINFTLELSPYPKDINIEEVSSIIVEDIMKKGIKVKIDTSALIQELSKPTFGPIVIAEGLPIIPSIDAKIERFFSEVTEEVYEEKQGRVDFRNKLKIPSVHPGEAIAKFHPPKEGKSGFNVYGEPLHPKPAKNIEIRTKNRVKLEADGTLIALQGGRPSITGRLVKTIEILETFEVHGDLDIKTGNIYFAGDVIIKGNVKDNMIIECSGSIYVYGNVYHSKLVASQHIYITGNVMHSQISAGQQSILYSKMYKTSQDVSIILKELIYAVNQLDASLRKKGLEYDYGHVVNTLVEVKFPKIFVIVNQLHSVIEEVFARQMSFPVQFKILLNSLVNIKSKEAIRKLQSQHAIESCQKAIKELIAHMESLISEKSDIHCQSANLSTIKTNGNIVIKKGGLVQSKAFAGNSILFEKRDAVIRGGKLEALKGIEAGIVGSESGNTPELFAGEYITIIRAIKCNLKFPNNHLTIDEPCDNIKIHFDPKTETLKHDLTCV